MYTRTLLPLIGLTLFQHCSAAVILQRTNVEGYMPLGCFVDSPENRQLRGDSIVTQGGMSYEFCVSFCANRGYITAGLEFGSECYCGSQFHDPPVQVDDSECNQPCNGDASETCGAANRLTVFSNGDRAPSTNPGTGGYTLIGCYNDTPSARSLSVSLGSSSSNTVASCVSRCSDAGYPLAGVEFGSECYCDSDIRNGAHVIDGGCDKICSGESREYCGGAGSIDIYKNYDAPTPTAAPIPDGWSSLGCYNDIVQRRTLKFPQTVPGGPSNNTVEGCLTLCQSEGYSLAGVEYGQECFCDNQISYGNQPASDQSVCHYPCTGNNAEICGGSAVINVYQFN